MLVSSFFLLLFLLLLLLSNEEEDSAVVMSILGTAGRCSCVVVFTLTTFLGLLYLGAVVLVVLVGVCNARQSYCRRRRTMENGNRHTLIIKDCSNRETDIYIFLMFVLSRKIFFLANHCDHIFFYMSNVNSRD